MKPSILPVVGSYRDKFFTQNKTKQEQFYGLISQSTHPWFARRSYYERNLVHML